MRLARVGCWVACAVALTAGGWSVPPRAATLAVPPRAGTATASSVAGYTLANAALTVGIATDCGGVPIDLVNRADDHALAGVRAYEPVEHLVTTNPRTRERRLWIGGSDAKLPLAWSVGFELSTDAALLFAECQLSNGSTQLVSMAQAHVPFDGIDIVSALPIVDANPAKPVLHPAFMVRGWDDGGMSTNVVLAAGETRSFGRWWYPVMGLGGLKSATRLAALNFAFTGTPGELFLGIHAPKSLAGCTVSVMAKGQTLLSLADVAIASGSPWCKVVAIPENLKEKDVRIEVRTAEGEPVVSYPAVAASVSRTQPSGNLVSLLEQAYQLRIKGDSAAASKTLRAVTAIAPMNPVAAVERIFLEDDGEGAVETLVKTRGFTQASLRIACAFYKSLHAKREYDELIRQGRLVFSK